MPSRQRLRSTRLLVATLVSICLVVITVDYRSGPTGPLEAFGKLSLAIMSPFQKGVSKITNPIGDFFSGLAHLPTLEADNARLRSELDATQSQIIKATTDQSRLATLEDLLGIKAALAPDTVGAVVIGNSISNFEWTITIDKGSSAGVSVGAPVVASPGTDVPPGFTGGLVGHVVRTTPYSSDVQLIIDPNSEVAGRLFTSGETGLIQGQGENDMRMNFVAASAPVRLDDLVSTVAFQASDFQSRYPPGIVIGKVSHILQDAGSPDKYVQVRPTVDFSSLEFVLVVVHQGTTP